MGQGDRPHVQRVQDVVSIGHGVHGVWAHAAVEAQVARDRAPVHPERVARQRAGAQGQGADAGQGVGEAGVVPGPGGGVGEEPVRPAHGLGGLQVRKPRHQHPHLRLRPRDRGLDQVGQVGARHVCQVRVQPEAGVGGDLVVARAACVQFAADRAHQLRQPPLVGGVDVFVPGLDDKGVRLPLGGDGVEAGDDGGGLVGRQHARGRERARVRLAAFQVLPPQPPVKGQRLVEGFHEGVGGAREAAAPQLLFGGGGGRG